MSGFLIVVVAVAGLFISLYFTFVSYGVMRQEAGWIPRACRMGEDTCRRVLGHRDAKVIGIPNSLVGVLYYSVVCVAAVAGFPPPLHVPLQLASWAAVGLGLYLTYSLAYRVRALCLLCMVSHALNIALALLLAVGPG